MTRRKELEEKCKDFLVAKPLSLPITEEPECIEALLNFALQVERECWERMWSGLKVDNTTLRWALKELGPTGTNAEAYVKAAVEHVIWCRDQLKEVSA